MGLSTSRNNSISRSSQPLTSMERLKVVKGVRADTCWSKWRLFRRPVCCSPDCLLTEQGRRASLDSAASSSVGPVMLHSGVERATGPELCGVHHDIGRIILCWLIPCFVSRPYQGWGQHPVVLLEGPQDSIVIEVLISSARDGAHHGLSLWGLARFESLLWHVSCRTSWCAGIARESARRSCQAVLCP